MDKALADLLAEDVATAFNAPLHADKAENGAGDGGRIVPIWLRSSLPVTDEMAIDLGWADEATIERVAARERAWKAAYAALPWRVRFMRRQVRPRWNEASLRLDHAWRALRGIECERDW